MTPIQILLMTVWSTLGLLGWATNLAKHPTSPGRTVVFATLSLPHAIIFGPIFLMLALVTRAQKECPHCKSMIPTAASVCYKCTRSVVKQRLTITRIRLNLQGAIRRSFLRHNRHLTNVNELWDQREDSAQSALKSESSPRPPLSQALGRKHELRYLLAVVTS